MSTTIIVATGLCATFTIAYLFSAWRILSREPRWALLVMLFILGLDVALRVVAPGAYPWGYHQDEFHGVSDTLFALEAPTPLQLFGFTDRVPTLVLALFEGLPFLATGGDPISIRGYSLLCSVLLCIAAYGLSRRLEADPASSLVAAALCAVLPWSILYGRTSQGISVALHVTLALWAIVGTKGERPKESALLLTLMLYLCLQDYYPARSAVFVAGLMAIGFRSWRAGVLLGAAILVSVGAYLAGAIPALPYSGNGQIFVYSVLVPFSPPDYSAPLTVNRLLQFFWSFVGPHAEPERLSLSAGAWHPWPVLLAAAASLLTRARWYLLAALVTTLAPAIVGRGPVNTNRLNAVYPVLAVAAGLGLSRWRVTRLLGLPLVVFAAWWSISLYFSPTFWTPISVDGYGDMRGWGRVQASKPAPSGEGAAVKEE